MICRLRSLFLPTTFLLILFLAACTSPAQPAPTLEPTAAAIPDPPTPTLTPAPADPTPTAIFPEETEPAASPTPVPARADAGADGAGFVMLLPGYNLAEERETLRGVTRDGAGYSLVADPLLEDLPVHNTDYAPATHRLLYWEWDSGGAGPGGVAAGPLYRLDLGSGARELVASGGVVEAKWAPDGEAFVTIVATPETYELRWHGADGEVRTLARDVVRSVAIDPAGERVAFTRESGYEVPGPPGLYVVAVSSGEETRLSAVDRAGMGGSGATWAPQWAPDGNSVLLLVNDETGDRFVWAAADGSWEQTLTDGELGEAVTATAGEGQWCVDTRAAFAGTTLVTGAMDCTEPVGLGPPPPTHLARFTLDLQQDTPVATTLFPLGEAAAQTSVIGWAEPGEAVLLYDRQADVVRVLDVR